MKPIPQDHPSEVLGHQTTHGSTASVEFELVALLKQTQAETIRYFDLPESDLAKTYDAGKWTVKEILVHLADVEAVLLDQLKRTISEPKQVIWAFDQDLWCQHLHYRQFPLPLSKSLYEACREQVIYLAGEFYETHGQKPFVHSETGVRTVKDEFEKVALHNAHHLDQIRRALTGEQK